jgi:hypothetical protein
MAARPSIPKALRRAVEVEAGHRCAIPTCRQIPTQIHHINENPADNRFENLIVLCPNCHQRVTARKIDRLAVEMYKANLSLLNERYSSTERRYLEILAAERAKGGHANSLVLATGFEVAMWRLISDGMVQPRIAGPAMVSNGIQMAPVQYVLTSAGEKLVHNLAEAISIDPEADDDQAS